MLCKYFVFLLFCRTKWRRFMKKLEVKNLVSAPLETVGHEMAVKRVVGGGGTSSLNIRK
jgi:hypothetical protein